VSTRFARVCGALAAVVLVATAGDQWLDPASLDLRMAGSGPTTGVRSTTGVRPAAGRSLGRALAKSDCHPQNLRASLRPQGPLATPGRLPAGSAMARITQRGYLIVVVLEDTYPLAFRDVNLRPEGFEVDIARDIAGAIFGDRERVVFRSTPRPIGSRPCGRARLIWWSPW
jgi:ABC-type amino acid transport substrate-binding protein